MRVGLLWCAKTFLERPKEWRAPSWSCISLEGPIEFQGMYRAGDSLANWKNCRMTLTGTSPYGGVLWGAIELEAPLYPVIFMEKATSLASNRENAASLTINFISRFGPGNGFLNLELFDANTTFVLLLASIESEETPGVGSLYISLSIPCLISLYVHSFL
jgi:hypothetical protein